MSKTNTPKIEKVAEKAKSVLVEKPKVEIVPAVLSSDETQKFVDYKDNLVILVKAEETHNTTAIVMIELFEELRLVMVEAGHPKAMIPMQIFESLRILLDNDETLDEKVLKRAKKELLTIVHYFQLSLEMRIRDIRFTLFMKVVTLAQSGDISKSSIKNALKKQGDAYVKALESLVTKAEYAKLVGSVNLGLIPAELQDAINSIGNPAVLSELTKFLKVKTHNVA